MAQGNAHSNPFLIAALGASADGLEAFERFFEHVPAETGIAFVLPLEQMPAKLEELETVNTKLSRKIAELDHLTQFAHAASHDLQESLRMVVSYTQLLARDYKGNLDQRARPAFTSRRNAAPVYGAFRFATMVSVSKRGTWRVSRQRYWPGDLQKSGGALWRPNLDGIRIWAAIDVPLYDPCVRW